ncbi:MAG TPA: RNA polymerase sigma factor RpoH [Caulobacteraceae bacterium]|jgi:RNA polymerase sigma-32 factor|nr:RNA polymerase sigma factor RpoH [Caulobacteraceae bacterium]
MSTAWSDSADQRGDAGLIRYLEDIRRFPMLGREEEARLARLVRANDDAAAAEVLITSHLRLVGKVAMQHRGYGLPIADVIEEGNIGLMQAVRRFDPDRECRLATYAIWWIRATIQEYVLRSWSMVKIGTTANQKKLFFGLRRAKSRLEAFEQGDLHPRHVAAIATLLGVHDYEVVEMNRRLAGDRALNAPINGEDGAGEWQDRLVDDRPDSEALLLAREQASSRSAALHAAIQHLRPRERRILEARRLTDRPLTLGVLAEEFGLSRERIRQIEVRAFANLQKAMRQDLPAPGSQAASRLGRVRARSRRPAGAATDFAPPAAARVRAGAAVGEMALLG